eukprot:scaffold15995_cov66-Phaeocystis_antarctica.AAC.1
MTDGVAGGSSMVTPNTLLIASRGFVCKAIAADSTWLAPSEVSVATTVRITLPAVTVTVSSHAGEKHFSSWRKLALTKLAFASYSSTVPPAFSTRVISLADTISLTAPGCKGDGGGGDGGGLGGGGASWWMVTSVLDQEPKSHSARHVARPCGGEDELLDMKTAQRLQRLSPSRSLVAVVLGSSPSKSQPLLPLLPSQSGSQ